MFSVPARNVPAPQTMASTPDGSFVLLLGGTGGRFPLQRGG